MKTGITALAAVLLLLLLGPYTGAQSLEDPEEDQSDLDPPVTMVSDEEDQQEETRLGRRRVGPDAFSMALQQSLWQPLKPIILPAFSLLCLSSHAPASPHAITTLTLDLFWLG